MVRTADGLELFAQQAGQGDDVVVVPNRIYMAEYFAHLEANHRVVYYDPRNRGLSESVADETKLARGVWHDVEDLESLRQHCQAARISILAYSYLAVAAALYAKTYPGRADKLILLGPPPPDPGKQYPPDLRSSDGSLEAFWARFTAFQSQANSLPPEERCRETWKLLNELYVLKPEDAGRLFWAPCGIPNEVNFMAPFMKFIMPSLNALHLDRAALAAVQAPTLIVHGRFDRSAPYGGGRDWAALLPHAKLITIDNAAHVPWIEAPDAVADHLHPAARARARPTRGRAVTPPRAVQGSATCP